jgi:hypothetical protein
MVKRRGTNLGLKINSTIACEPGLIIHWTLRQANLFRLLNSPPQSISAQVMPHGRRRERLQVVANFPSSLPHPACYPAA